jgi:glycosyltransferase involved in cell wall biosynthesis
MGTIWIISELYYPEETSTGHFMTHIAEALAQNTDVAVICAQPTYSKRGVLAPRRETRRGVRILRCRSTRFDKNRWGLKILNAITVSVALFGVALKNIRLGDRVISVTNPPLLPYLIAVAARLRGSSYSLKIDDLYPETLIATGMLQPGSLITNLWQAVSHRLYRGANRIFVLGSDMAALVSQKTSGGSRVVVITNWADNEEVVPMPKSQTRLVGEYGLADKFVVQCAGNLGPVQGLDCIVEAAAALADRPSVHFIFLGSGKREWALRKRARELRLQNISFLGQYGRDEQIDFLNACDVAIVSLLRGMQGISVPSRTYNTMAAGRPIIAVMEKDCEVASMVREHEIGWVVPPGDAAALAAAIREAEQEPERLAAMARRARRLAESVFARSSVLASYVRAFAPPSNRPLGEAAIAETVKERFV